MQIEQKHKDLSKCFVPTVTGESFNLEELQNEIGALDAVTSRIMRGKSLSSEIRLSDRKDRNKDATARHAQYLLELAQERILKKAGYVRLLSLLFFFCLYSAATLLQREGNSAMAIENRFVTQQAYLTITDLHAQPCIVGLRLA
jgi:hypothetical protein